MNAVLKVGVLAALVIGGDAQVFVQTATATTVISSGSADCLGASSWSGADTFAEFQVNVGEEDSACGFFGGFNFNIPEDAHILGISFSSFRDFDFDSNFRDVLVRLGVIQTRLNARPLVQDVPFGANNRVIRYPQTGYSMFGASRDDLSVSLLNGDSFSVGLKVGRGGAAGFANLVISDVQVEVQFARNFPLQSVVTQARQAAAQAQAPRELSANRIDYLTQINHVITYFTERLVDGRIIDADIGSEIQFSTPCYAHAGAVLLSHQEEINDLPNNLLASVSSALTTSLNDLVAGTCANDHCHFYTVPLIKAIDAMEEVDGVDATQIQAWRNLVASITPATSYNGWPTTFVSPNWAYASVTGEFLRTGITDDISSVIGLYETNWFANGLFLDDSGCFRSCSSVAYDHFPRYYVSLMLDAGLDSSIDLERNRQGAWTSLLMQSPQGEMPTGGRGSQHVWNEALQCVTFEFWAKKLDEEGDDVGAALFRRGAALSLFSMSQFIEQDKAWYLVKNQFPSNERFGYESFSFYSQFNLLSASLLAAAVDLAQVDISTEGATFAEVGGFVFEVNGLNKIIANANGMYSEIETKPTSSEPMGLTRFHNIKSNPFAGLSEGTSGGDGTALGVGVFNLPRQKPIVVEQTASLDSQLYVLENILGSSNPNNDESLVWYGANTNARFVLDFGTVVPMLGISLRNTLNNRATQNIEIRTSEDGVEWGDVHAYTLSEYASTPVIWEHFTWIVEFSRYVEVVLVDSYGAVPGLNGLVVRTPSVEIEEQTTSLDPERFRLENILESEVPYETTNDFAWFTPSGALGSTFVLDLKREVPVSGISLRNSHNREYQDRSTAAVSIRTSTIIGRWTSPILFDLYSVDLSTRTIDDDDFLQPIPWQTASWFTQTARYVEVRIESFQDGDVGAGLNGLQIMRKNPFDITQDIRVIYLTASDTTDPNIRYDFNNVLWPQDNRDDERSLAWISTPSPPQTPQFILDLGSVQQVNGVSIRNTQNAPGTLQNVLVQTSLDLVTWRDHNVNVDPASDSTIQGRWVHNFWTEESTRYVRAIMTGTEGNHVGLSGFVVRTKKVEIIESGVSYDPARFNFENVLWSENPDDAQKAIWLGLSTSIGDQGTFVLDMERIMNVHGVTVRNSHNFDFNQFSTKQLTVRTSLNRQDWGEPHVIHLEDESSRHSETDRTPPWISNFWIPEKARYMEIVFDSFYGSLGPGLNSFKIEAESLGPEQTLAAVSFEQMNQVVVNAASEDRSEVAYSVDYTLENGGWSPFDQVKEEYVQTGSSINVTSTLFGSGLPNIGVRFPTIVDNGELSASIRLPDEINPNSICVSWSDDSSTLYTVTPVTEGTVTWTLDESASAQSRNGFLASYDAVVVFDEAQDDPVIQYSVTSFSGTSCIATGEPTSSPTRSPITSAPTNIDDTPAPTSSPTTRAPVPPTTLAPTPEPTNFPTVAPVPTSLAPSSSPTIGVTSAPVEEEEDDESVISIPIIAGVAGGIVFVLVLSISIVQWAKSRSNKNVVEISSKPTYMY